MALFVLILVGLVVAVTWLDFRDTRKNWVMPDWAKGTALAGVIAASLTAATSFASVWIQDQTGQADAGFGTRLFWLELVFLLCVMGIIVWGARKKQLRLAMLLAGVVAAALFWLGISL
jgi:hypothetical protein